MNTRLAPALMLFGLASAARAEEIESLWPSHYPTIAGESVRPELTESLRTQRKTLGLDALPGEGGETVSKAVALFPKKRELPGIIAFEIESGPRRGVHRCEALGRGRTSLEPKEGWKTGVVEEPDGRKTTIYYAPGNIEDGATLPGIYELRNIRPKDYTIKLLNKDAGGESGLARRLGLDDKTEKPYFSGVWKSWYPRDPRYSDIAPIDMIWSERYQPRSRGASYPVYEYKGAGKKDPEQTRHNPRYYFGPYGRYGTAIHTDRWSDAETAADPKSSGRSERRSFLFRDTAGCVKVRPDCLQLLNAFVDEQASKGRRVLLEVRERE